MRNLSYLFFSGLFLVACSTIDTQAEYSNATPRSSSDLTLPPGLSSPDTSQGLKMLSPSNQGYTLNKIKDMKIVQGGSERYLLIRNRNVNQVWDSMLAYLNQSGLSIKYKNQTVGIIQTDWANKNNQVKETDIREFFSWVGWGSMYSLKSQFMFRINLWQNESDTQVFVTDYQMNEVYPGCAKYLNQDIKVYSSDTQVPIWMPLPPDPQLELEFLLKFMAFNGLSSIQLQQSESQVKHYDSPEVKKQAVLVGSSLVIYDNFDRSWWRTSLALERSGLGIADRNRSSGEFYVYPLQSQIDNSDPGFLARWFGNDKNSLQLPKPRYIVKLVTQGNQTTLNLSLYFGINETDFGKNQTKYLNELLKQLQ